jgi:hypothetical protein
MPNFAYAVLYTEKGTGSEKIVREFKNCKILMHFYVQV